jgi:leader peptidase (prepilin peptidase)/N-methyltransferase
MNEILKKQTKRTFIPVILVCTLAVVWCFFIVEGRVELIRAIILIIFMNIIATINYYEDIIHDKLNLLLGVTGIVFNIASNIVSVPSMLGGLLIGGGSLYLIAIIYELSTRREGLGGGVIKYNAALGLWLGIQGIIISITCALILGIVFGIIVLPLYKMIRSKDNLLSVPADGFFSAGAFLTVLYGDSVISRLF